MENLRAAALRTGCKPSNHPKIILDSAVSVRTLPALLEL